MSIDKYDVIDKMGIHRNGSEVMLLIVDPLDWTDPLSHLSHLQEKLSKYVGFVKTGQLLEQLPTAKGLPVRIQVLGQHELPASVSQVTASVQQQLTAHGIALDFVKL